MILKTSYKMKPPPSAKPRKNVIKKLGIAGLWAMTERNGLDVFDLSGNKNTGALSGGASWAFDKFGSVTMFQTGGGAQKITIPHTDIINFDSYTDNFTFMIWAKGGSQGGYRLAEKKTVAINVYPLSMQGPAGVALNGVCYDGSNLVIVSYGNVWDDILHQITFVVDHEADKINGYLDGVLVDSANNTTTSGTSNNKDLYLGNNAESTRSFNGIISHCFFSNRVLLPFEINFLNARPFYMFDRPAEPLYHIATPPPAQQLFMDLGSWYWTIKKASGLFTRL